MTKPTPRQPQGAHRNVRKPRPMIGLHGSLPEADTRNDTPMLGRRQKPAKARLKLRPNVQV